MLDQSSLRTRAASDGIRASLGPAQLAVGGGMRGYEVILNQGPCALYEKLKEDHQIGNVQAIHFILSSNEELDIQFADNYIAKSHYDSAIGETAMIVVSDGLDLSEIASISGDYKIEEAVVVSIDNSSNEYIFDP